MANSSAEVKFDAGPRQEFWQLQQHDSATTLDLSGSMEVSKGDSTGADLKMLNQETLREFGLAVKKAGSGFASRETSPERGSTASYRITSRPGTAQSYSAAEIKKHYAGQLRMFSDPHASTLPASAQSIRCVCSWASILCLELHT